MLYLYAASIDTEGPSSIPEEFHAVLVEFDNVFGEPTKLPPCRAWDHQISLMFGAQPVNIRAYLHKPEHKSKIER